MILRITNIKVIFASNESACKISLLIDDLSLVIKYFINGYKNENNIIKRTYSKVSNVYFA